MAPEGSREPPPDTDNETELRIWRQQNLRHKDADVHDDRYHEAAARAAGDARGGPRAPGTQPQEPAPGEANPLSKKEQRPFDRREREP